MHNHSIEITRGPFLGTPVVEEREPKPQTLHKSFRSYAITMKQNHQLHDTICHNITMSFDQEQNCHKESSREEIAARALLSLTPVDARASVNVATAKALPNQYTGMESSRRGLIPARPNAFQVLNHPELSPNTVLTQPTTFLNLPVLPSSAATSCESSLDGRRSPIPEWTDNNGTRFYSGSVTLAISEDEESLSPLHCFMRKYCVEAFSASAEDVSTPRYGKSHGRNIVVGQVGIQCVHCKHRPYARRQERSVCFPSSIKNIYHSIETWQRRHSTVCQDIPAWAKRTMLDLMGQSRSGAGGRRQYWETSARRLGMEDTSMGIRFNRTPGSVAPLEAVVSPAEAPEEHPPSRALVFPDDKKLVTDYLFMLLEQMETCYFSEQDRVGGRSKVKNCPTGYPGLQCKHCAGKAGFGRYFPVSIQALTSANSDRNIFNHIVKCRRCPDQIKQELQLYLSQQKHAKNRRGLRKVFFQRVWQRMHGSPASPPPPPHHG